MWYAPKTLLPCFLLGATVTGGEDFNSNRRQLQGGSRPVNFDGIHESRFLPTLPGLDLNGTFVCVDGGG